MKKRRLIAVILLLLALGGLLALYPIRIRALGFLNGERFFRGLPASYWRERALEHDRLRKARSALPAGLILIDEVSLFPSPTSWSDSILAIFSTRPAADRPDFRIFEGDPSAMAVLIDLLGDQEVGVRQAACEGLERIGPAATPAIPALIEVLLGKEAVLQGPAAEALGKIGPAAVPPLLEKLVPQADEEEAIFLALGEIGPDAAPAIPALLGALQDKDRHGASFALGSIGPRAVPALREGLKSSDWEVRWRATRALSRTGADPDLLVPILVKLLKDKDAHVRQSAAGGLGRLGPAARDGVPALIEALEDQEGAARREAVDSLGWIGPDAQAAVPALTRMLEKEPSDDYMRQCIQQALKKIKNEKESEEHGDAAHLWFQN